MMACGVPCSGGRPPAVMPPPGCGDTVPPACVCTVVRAFRHERLRLRAGGQRSGLRRAGECGRRIDAGRQDQRLADLQRVRRAQVVELDERADRDALARGDAGYGIALLHHVAVARLQVQHLPGLQRIGRRQAVEVDQRADRRVGALGYDRDGIARRDDILAVLDLAERRAGRHRGIGRGRRGQHGVEIAAGKRRRGERDGEHDAKVRRAITDRSAPRVAPGPLPPATRRRPAARSARRRGSPGAARRAS